MKKTYKAIAQVTDKKRISGMILAIILMVLCVVAFLLSIYSFYTKNMVFGIGYIIAILLGLSYIIIKINQLYTTYIAADDEYLVLKCWDNHFFAYNVWKGIPFIRDFIPSKSRIFKIPVNEITDIILGTKTYIKRNAGDLVFDKAIEPYEKRKYSTITKTLEKFNILYIKTQDDCCFMSIDGFDAKETMSVLNTIIGLCNSDIRVLVNARSFKRYLKLIDKETEENE